MCANMYIIHLCIRWHHNLIGCSIDKNMHCVFYARHFMSNGLISYYQENSFNTLVKKFIWIRFHLPILYNILNEVIKGFSQSYLA